MTVLTKVKNPVNPLQELRELCISKSQKEVARMFGVTPQYICDMVNGRREVSEKIWRKMGWRKIWMKNPIESA